MQKAENIFQEVLTDKEFKAALDLFETDQEKFAELLSEKISAKIEKRIYKDRTKIFKKKSALFSEYRKHISHDFPFYLENLALQIENAHQIGEQFSRKVHENPKKANLRLYLIDKLFAQCILISNEIYALISSGFASGAVARWRSLHESSVILQVLKQGNDDLSLRYWHHAHITEFSESLELKNMKPKHRQQVTRSRNQFKAKEKKKVELHALYGREFKAQYGWARTLFPNKNPDFSDLEKLVGLGHYHYGWKTASTKVHAGSLGLLRPLHAPPDIGTEVVGPSNYGLFVPTYNTCLTLLLTSNHICVMQPSLQTHVLQNAMLIIVEALKLYEESEKLN